MKRLEVSGAVRPLQYWAPAHTRLILRRWARDPLGRNPRVGWNPLGRDVRLSLGDGLGARVCHWGPQI